MRIIAMVVMLIIMTGLFVNTGRQIFFWLTLVFKGVNQPVHGVVFSVVFGLLVVAVLAAFVISRIPGNADLRAVFRIGHYALGALVYLVLIVNAASLFLFLGRLFHLVPPESGAVQMAAAGISLLLVTGLTVCGSIHAGNIQTRRYTVRIGREQEGTDSLRIALLSDIHLGYVIEEDHLAKVVEAVNELKPDIICIAGDVFDGDATSLSNPDRLQALLGEMKAQYGVYACLGNHDAGAGYEQMLEFLSGAGVQVLLDESVVIDGRFVLAGRRDSFPIGGQGERQRSVEGLTEASVPVGTIVSAGPAVPAGPTASPGPAVPSEKAVFPATARLPVIVMDHQPGNIQEYGSEADLILCGHTHQGQMFPFNLITNAVFDVDYGYYRKEDTGTQVIVTSGAGTWGPPLRVATDSEVVEIRVIFPETDGGKRL